MEHALAHQKLEQPSGAKSRGKEDVEQPKLPFLPSKRDQLVQNLMKGNKEAMSHRSGRGGAASPFAPGKDTMTTKALTTTTRLRQKETAQASGSRSSPIALNGAPGPSSYIKPQTGWAAVEGSRRALPLGTNNDAISFRSDSIRKGSNPLARRNGRGDHPTPGVQAAAGSSDIDGLPATPQWPLSSPQSVGNAYPVEDDESPPLSGKVPDVKHSNRQSTRTSVAGPYDQPGPASQKSTTPSAQRLSENDLKTSFYHVESRQSHQEPGPSRTRRPTSNQTSPSDREVIDLVGDSPPAKNTRNQVQADSPAVRSPPSTGEPDRPSSIGAFGSHKSRHSPGHVQGRMQHPRSVSPTKQPVSRNEPDRTPILYDDEVEESVEIDDPIEDPDGLFKAEMNENDFQVVGQGPRTGVSRVNGENTGGMTSPQKDSSGRTVLGMRKLRAMKTKAGSTTSPKADKTQNKGTHNPNAVIQSSLKHRLAEISYARLVDFPLAIPAASIRVDQRALSLNTPNTAGMLNLPINQLVDLTTHDSNDHPLLMATFDSPNDKLVNELGEFLHTDVGQSSGLRLKAIKILVALKPGSGEARNLIGILKQYAKLEGCENSTVLGSDESARRILESLSPVDWKDDTRPRRRTAKSQAADAAEKRWRKIKDTRVDEDADAGWGNQSSREQPVKGKGKAKEDSNQSKLSFAKITVDAQGESRLAGAPESQEGRRTSRRLTGQPARVYHDIDDDEVEPVPPPRNMESALTVEERGQVLFPYPPEGRPDLIITRGDRARVAMNDFLNDTLLEFGLRHVVDSLGDETKERIHLFNSFFYDKLTNKKGKWVSDDSVWPGYESVKKWTKNRNIFEKEFVIVPINENFHWYLAVIYNPSGILRERPSVEEEGNATPMSVDQVDAMADAGDECKSDRPSPVKNGPNSPEVDELTGNYGEGDQQLAPSEGSAPSPVKGHGQYRVPVLEIMDDTDELYAAGDQSAMSIDPLLLTDDADGDGLDMGNLDDATDRVRELSISKRPGSKGACSPIKNDPPSSPGTGGAIMTPTMRAVAQQSQRAAGTSPQIADGNTKAVSKSGKPDHNIRQSGQCWIFTCDSLGGAHKEVGRSLERWLFYEARDKKVITHNRPSSVPYIEAKVPSQPNFSDCGLFLIHYVKQLLEHTEEIMTFIEKPVPRPAAEKARWEQRKQEVWRAGITGHLRKEWTDIIDLLTAQSNSLRTQGRHRTPTPAEDDSQDDIHFVTDGLDLSVSSEKTTIANSRDPKMPLPYNVPEPLQAPSNTPNVPADDSGQDVEMKGMVTPEEEELVEEAGEEVDAERPVSEDSAIDPHLDDSVGMLAADVSHPSRPDSAERESSDGDLHGPLTADTVHQVRLGPSPSPAPLSEDASSSEDAPSPEQDGELAEKSTSEGTDGSSTESAESTSSVQASNARAGYRMPADMTPVARIRTVDIDKDADEMDVDCSPFDNLGQSLLSHDADDDVERRKAKLVVTSRPGPSVVDPGAVLDSSESDASSSGDWRDLAQRGVPVNGDREREESVVVLPAKLFPQAGSASLSLSSPPRVPSEGHSPFSSPQSMDIGPSQGGGTATNDTPHSSDPFHLEFTSSTPTMVGSKPLRTYGSRRQPVHTTQNAVSKRALPENDTPSRVSKKSRPSGENGTGQTLLTSWATRSSTTKEKEATLGNGTSEQDAIELSSSDYEGETVEARVGVRGKGTRTRRRM